MTTKPEWHDVGLAMARQDVTKPLLWHYLPKTPHLRLGPDGKVQHSLIDAGGMIMLGLTAELGLDEAAQDHVRAAIVKAMSLKGEDGKPLAPHKLELQAEPLLITRARLSLGDETSSKDLASVTPSGFGMQSAAFMVTVSGPDADALKSALAGNKGRLTVHYEGSRAEERNAEVSLKGKIADVLGDVERPEDKQAAEELIEKALEAGSITLETRHDEGVSTQLRQAALTKARLLLVEGLLRFTREPVPPLSGMIDAAAHQSETVSVPYTAAVDVTF
jgi:hypothetical protein